jgi:hypothetical protein
MVLFFIFLVGIEYGFILETFQFNYIYIYMVIVIILKTHKVTVNSIETLNKICDQFFYNTLIRDLF